ncbi:MAG: hypothetical protein PSV23_15285 [Brevundimonas sp.]|uniref:hypothetical protein n=1 Tax=Brevundimonas sp. TaxID=1871086 RepID=UPI00248A0BF6|nr:hypothetical protein [Brevundimonas sp.]MDI1328155.1 hypothetical protein [Brevundimonas sp.]
MRKTAIILAGAAIFDLGVVVVSVQAQESLRPTPGTVVTAPGTTSNRDHIDQDAQLRGCANGKHLPEAQLSACRDTTADSSSPAGQTRAVDMFLKIDRVNSVQACTARRGEVVRHEGVQQCRLPATGDADIHKQGLALNYTKIDIHYTARACVAQQGEVVTREGVQQCALPANPGDNRVRPNRR